MPKIPDSCIEFSDKRKICIATEKSKTYKLQNDSLCTVTKIKVDRCLPQNIGEGRCDYLMLIEDKRRVFFIELKGSDLKRGLEQIYDTVIYLKDNFRQFQLDARIVGSRDVPAFLDSIQYRKLAKEIIPTKGTIKKGTNNIYIETV